MTEVAQVLRSTVKVYGSDGWGEAGYLASVPPAVEPQGWPVILMLPGSGDIGYDDPDSRFKQFHRKALDNFVIVVPVAPKWRGPLLEFDPTKKYNEDVLLYVLQSAIEEVRQRHGDEAVDAGRISVTGYSLGGEAAWNVAARFGHLLAAAAPLACPGCDDIVYTEKGAWNLSHLPVRAYQSATDRSSHKADRLVKWLGDYTSWQDPTTESMKIDGQDVSVKRFGSAGDPTSSLELWEINPWRDGEKVNYRDIRNHDVWMQVYGDEEGYGLFSWLLNARNPRGCRMLRNTSFTVNVPAASPHGCSAHNCPASRSGAWLTVEGEREVVGTFPEWQRAEPLRTSSLKRFREGFSDELLRVGDRVVARSGGDWSVERPFGLQATAPQRAQACHKCGEVWLGWQDRDGANFQCVSCWGNMDRAIRRQGARLRTRWQQQRGDFLDARQGEADEDLKRESLHSAALLRCSCTQAVTEAFRELAASVERRCRRVSSPADLGGTVLLWAHDGARATRTIELCEDGRVRYGGGAKQGHWRLTPGNGVDVVFGHRPEAAMLHRMRWTGGAASSLVLEEPVRHPPTTATVVEQSRQATGALRKSLQELEVLLASDPSTALFELVRRSEALCQSVEQLPAWRHCLRRYLRDFNRPVLLSQINRDLKFQSTSNAVSKSTLKMFPHDFMLSRDKMKQLRAQLRTSPRPALPLKKVLAKQIFKFLIPARRDWTQSRESYELWLKEIKGLHRDVRSIVNSIVAVASSSQPASLPKSSGHGASTPKDRPHDGQAAGLAAEPAWAFLRAGDSVLGHAGGGSSCLGQSEGWMPASLLARASPRSGLLVEFFDGRNSDLTSEGLDIERPLLATEWPTVDRTSTRWPILDTYRYAVRLEGVLLPSGSREFRLRTPPDSRATVFLDGYRVDACGEAVSWSQDEERMVRIDVFKVPQALAEDQPLQLQRRAPGGDWESVPGAAWQVPESWPLVLPLGAWLTRGCKKSPAAARRVSPSRVATVEPATPKLSLLQVRWGTPLKGGAGEMTPTDDFVEEFARDHVWKTLGPNYQIFTAFVQSSDDLRFVSEAWAAANLRGTCKAALVFLWPTKRQDPQPPGFVSEGVLFDLLTRLERAGIPCRYPHSPHVYRTLAGKAWAANLSALPDYHVPPTCRISAGAAAAGATAAAAQAAAALDGLGRRGRTLGPDFIVKLGFSWNSADVRGAEKGDLAAVMKQMLESGQGRHEDVLVQRRVTGIICEPSLFVADGDIVEMRFVTEVLGNRHFKSMDEAEALAQLFRGEKRDLEVVVEETRRLAGLLLKWLAAECGGPPSFVRLDFLAARSADGTIEVWTGEVCEFGGGLCGLSGGRSVPFQVLLKHCLEAPMDKASLARQGGCAPSGRQVSLFVSSSGSEAAQAQGLRLAKTCGWVEAEVAEDTGAGSLRKADGSTTVAVRVGGRTLRADPSDLLHGKPPAPKVSVLVVRQGGPKASQVPPSLWFSESAIGEVLGALVERFPRECEVFTAAVETDADLTALSAAWAATALQGQLRLGCYFLCPSLDAPPLPAGYVGQHALLDLMSRMEAVGLRTWFPNGTCQYSSLVQKTWSVHLCVMGELQLPASTRVPRSAAAVNPRRAAQRALESLARVRRAPADGAERRGVVKLAPSWEGRGVWFFDSEAALAELLAQAFSSGALHDHCIVQDFVADVVLEMRLHVINGEVAKLACTRCRPKTGALSSSFGGKLVDGSWASAGFVEGEGRDEIAEACFGGAGGDFDEAESACRGLVERWWPFLLADCCEPPVYVRFDFLVARKGPGKVEVWTGEITELGGQLCGWPEGRRRVIAAMLDDAEECLASAE